MGKKQRLLKFYKNCFPLCFADCDKKNCKHKISDYEQSLLQENGIGLEFVAYDKETCGEYYKGE